MKCCLHFTNDSSVFLIILLMEILVIVINLHQLRLFLFHSKDECYVFTQLSGERIQPVTVTIFEIRKKPQQIFPLLSLWHIFFSGLYPFCKWGTMSLHNYRLFPVLSNILTFAIQFCSYFVFHSVKHLKKFTHSFAHFVSRHQYFV